MILNKIFLTIRSKGFNLFLLAVYYFFLRKILLIFNKKIITKKIFNFEMNLYLDDEGISKTLILFGQRELDHKYILEKILKTNMKILDIGANIGYYLLLENQLIGKKGKIIAVEPSSKNIKLLNSNLELNKINNCKVIHGAISNFRGTEEFFISSKSNLNTFHVENKKNLSLTGETELVETYTVKQIIENNKIDLIRMDVEGHEVQIIEGLIDDINDNLKPMIIFEPHTSRYKDAIFFEKILNKLFKKNYTTLMISSNSINGSKKIEEFGYKSFKKILTDDVERRIYKNISNQDLIDLITKTGGLRTVLFVPKDTYNFSI